LIAGILYFTSVWFSGKGSRDHRHLPVARSVPVERSETSTERDAGRCSVDRMVRLYFLGHVAHES
ncbi:hypothetical protein, partial [Chlorobium phaeovibrioides]|uniref:hypothetical protein n=1 Tax=Chlorobium phaeovibrioides TaxID=1094 RepID=UPI001F19B1E4